MATKQATSPFRINLGAKVKDRVTGFTGIVIGRTEWMNGCKRYGVQPVGLTKEGKPKDSDWIDEQQLVVVKGGVSVTQGAVGGPQPAPKRQADPTL